MMHTNNRREFYVVQLIELPFEGIDDYVCVPHSWLIQRKATDERAVVAYPQNEDPLDTRERVERKDRYIDEWRHYTATIKYESNSYKDAEFWIATRNYYGPLVEETLQITDTQHNNLSKSKDSFRKPLLRLSIKRRAKSKEVANKRLKVSHSFSAGVNNINLSAILTSILSAMRNNTNNITIGSSKRKQPIITQYNQSMERSRAEETSVSSITEPRSKTARTNVSKTTAKTSTEEHNPGRISLSNCQPQIENVRPLANIDDHKLLNQDSSQDLSTFYKGLNSPKISAHLYSHMNKSRRLIPIQKPIEMRLRPMKMERNLAIDAQAPSNSIDQTRHLSTSSVEPTVVNQDQSQNDPQILRRNIGNSSDQTAPLRNFETSDDLAAVDPRNFHQKVNNVAATSHHLASTQTNLMDDAAGSPVIRNHLNAMDMESMMDETLSLYHAVPSNSDAVSEDEENLIVHISTDESPLKTTNNVFSTRSDSMAGYGSADETTAAQNSTARSHQMNPKVVLEQQMFDKFGTLFNEMRSTLRYTTDTYNTLRSSILDTVETNKKCAVEQLNTARNAASNASPSSNLRPERQSPEEIRSNVTASPSSSKQYQHNNDVVQKTSKKKHKKFRFVLPPEYDAYDTRWTLRYRTNLPGLVELMPRSGVYINYGDLKYCQKVSKDCKSLALLLLSEVFNRNALSVCSSMSETARTSDNVGSKRRPDLDDHACSVLLNFVIEHGLERGWNTDLEPILSTLHSKVQEIRFKFGVMVEC